ncbi:MAG TPA: hypothetical protein VGN57_06945 [Pirellulaceae bacterium]|nr:hypothetical protein [Pirellulaceae bacterium]
MSPSLGAFRKLLPALAALATLLFLGVGSLSAQPPERSSAEKSSAPATKPARADRKNDSPAKPADEKKQGEKRASEKKQGEKQADEKKSEAKKGEERKFDREAVAKAFAEEHHQELAALLRTLEEMSPHAYETAVRDVARAADRLAGLKERDQPRYERELEVWKTRSRVHVVSAEYRVSPGPDLEKKLRELMQDELQAKRELLAFDRERAEKRLEQIERQLHELDEKGSAMIDRQIERLPKIPASIPKPKPKT